MPTRWARSARGDHSQLLLPMVAVHSRAGGREPRLGGADRCQRRQALAASHRLFLGILRPAAASSRCGSCFRFFRSRADIYEQRRSAAEVALVYSRTSLDYEGGSDPDLNYLDGFRGAYNALMDGRVPFDLVSISACAPRSSRATRPFLLPNLACMVRRDGDRSGKVHGSGRACRGDVPHRVLRCLGLRTREPWVAKLLGARYAGRTQRNLKAAYALVGRSDHAVLAGVGDTDLLPLAGSVLSFRGR